MLVQKFYSAVIAAAVLLLASFASAAEREFRGLWVDAWGKGFLNQSQVDELIADARANHFNAVIVQMRRRGDAFYMPGPNGEPRTTALASDFDALAALISAAHNGSPRIEVHCWVTTFPVWSSETIPPPQPDHILNLHPEYLMKNSTGQTYLGEGYYVDPGHPEAMRWTARVAKDIVSRYPVDGFHWDYVRYPMQDAGYNETAIARYNEEFGFAGQPASTNAQFAHWRRRQVSDFIRWTNADLLEIRPGLAISAAVFANRSDAFSNRFQDWSFWNQRGIVDFSLPMNYTTSNSTFGTRVNDFLNHQGVRKIYVGPGAYLNTKENTLIQLQMVRDAGLLGTALYSYRVPNSGIVDRADTFDFLRSNYQPTWKETPELPWKTATGVAKGRVIDGTTGEIVYNAHVIIDGVDGAGQRSCAQGGFAFYNLTGGARTVTASANGLFASETITIAPGGVHHVDLMLGERPAVPPETFRLTNFENAVPNGTSGSVLFRNPNFSGNSNINLQPTPNLSQVTRQGPSGLSGEQSLRVAFAFLPNRLNPWLRLTTHGTTGSVLPNPIVPLDRTLRFDIHTNHDVHVAVGIRDNGAVGTIGSNGGADGDIDWVGGTTDNYRTGLVGTVPPLGRLVKAGQWTTLHFNLPEEPVKAFTGDGILTNSRGVFEELTFVPVIAADGTYPTTAFDIHLDNFEVTTERAPGTATYQSWAEASLPQSLQGKQDDPGAYGISNLLRYALDLDPLAPSPDGLPVLGQTETTGIPPEKRLTITFTRRTDDLSLNYIIEASTDLIDWTQVTGAEQTIPRNDRSETVTVTDLQAIGDRQMRFLRLRVE